MCFKMEKIFKLTLISFFKIKLKLINKRHLIEVRFIIFVNLIFFCKVQPYISTGIEKNIFD